MYQDTLLTRADGCNGSPVHAAPSIATARERAWFKDRIERGRRERFAEVGKLTPGIAALALEHNDRNRALTSRQAEVYANAMAEGRWRLSTQGIAFSATGRLIDGQHRCAAVERSAVSVPMLFWFGVSDNEFDIIDTGRSRNAGDLISIDGLTNFVVRAGIAAAELRLRHRTTARWDAARVRALAIEMQSAPLDAALHYASQKMLQKIVGPTPAALAYLKIASATKFPEKVDTFFSGLATGADLAAASPILRLRHVLPEVAKGTNSGRTIHAAGSIILAWNAFVTRRTIRNLDWKSSTELPEVI